MKGIEELTEYEEPTEKPAASLDQVMSKLSEIIEMLTITPSEEEPEGEEMEEIIENETEKEGE